jgi:hypothetical protein
MNLIEQLVIFFYSLRTSRLVRIIFCYGVSTATASRHETLVGVSSMHLLVKIDCRSRGKGDHERTLASNDENRFFMKSCFVVFPTSRPLDFV